MKTHKEWFEDVVNRLYWNALIEMESRTNRRNFAKDPYYNNYDKFTSVSKHEIQTFEEFNK